MRANRHPDNDGEDDAAEKIEEIDLDKEAGNLTDDFADISLGKCPKCGQVWLRYLTENEGYTGSGRWYLGAISDLQANMIPVNQAKALLEGLEWYWVGGSYFSGQIRVSRGNIL